MAQRRKPRNPEQVLFLAEQHARDHGGRRKSRTRLHAAQRRYAQRVIGRVMSIESLGRVTQSSPVTRPSTTEAA